MQELHISPNSPIFLHLQKMYGNSALVLCCYAANGEILYCTDACLKFFDASSLKEYQRNFHNYSPKFQMNGKSSTALCKENIAKAFKESGYAFPWVHILPNGEQMQVNYTLTRMECKGVPIITSTMFYSHGCTESLGELYYRDENMQALFETSPMAACLWDASKKFVDCNASLLELLNISSKDRYALCPSIFHPLHQPRGENSTEYAATLMEQALQEGQAIAEWVWLDSAGRPVPTFITLRRVKYGNASMVAEYIYDLRPLRESEAQTQEIEQRNKVVLDAMPLSMSFWDKDYNLIDCNLASVNLFGFKSKKEYMEKFNQVSPEFQPDGKPSLEALHAKFDEARCEGISHVEWMHQQPDASLVPVDKTCVRATHKGEDVVVTFSRDLREIYATRKKADEAELRNKLMLNAMPLGVHFWDENFTLIDCNVEALKLFGACSKEAHLSSFYQNLPPVQPCGINSKEYILHFLKQAMQEGHAYCDEFMCFGADAKESMPVEVSFTRIAYNDAFSIVCYIRDLRSFKAMLSEIQQVEDNLRAAKNLAEKNAAAKNEFLANMSHEMRTPMNGILGLMHLLEKTSLQNEQNSYVQKTIHSAKNLLRIIDDILDFSHMETGKLTIEPAPFTLQSIFHDMEEWFAPRCVEKGLLWETVCHQDEAYYWGDALRIKQVLFNILDNAIKFTAHGGITVTAEKDQLSDTEVRCLFSVRDTGIGIDIDSAEDLFSAFMQVDTSFTRAYGGTGLGLGISYGIVTMMQGEIWVESSLGAGATFYVSLVLPLVNKEECFMEGATQQNEIPRSPAHLLLVEDNEINQLVAEEILLQAGYTVDIAKNGSEALDMLKEKLYDLVLMDIQMPVMDGLTATLRIREQKEFADLPIIALSAHALEEDRRKSIACGMNEHTTKPIEPQNLYRIIEEWVGKNSQHAN